MKKIVWLFMSAMALSLAISCDKENEEEIDNNSPIIEFTDPRTLQILLDRLDGLDRNGDGKISESEAASKWLTFIPLYGAGVRNFDEIYFFKNLTEIDLGYNELTHLDISKNTKLLSLMCGGNQLTRIDLSKNLKYLDCSTNQLTTLDLSRNTALIGLIFNDNQVTALDVSEHTALTTLDGCDNQLTVLNLSKNIALTYLGCKNNQLTTLDLSRNTALERLFCSDNQLTTLDLSKNTALTELDCSNNQLTTLDLSKNKLLGKYSNGTINIDGNPLKKLIISKYHILPDRFIEKYKSIIEFVE